jgi:endonuclease/exonuclease/phosphatase family metal-dependent hydrolase
MFWNVENLFDPFDDSLKMDNEFTPTGNHGWTWKRFDQKIIHIYKVIVSGGWQPPDLIGLCEVENRWVLEQLTQITPLSKFEYKIIHQNSPDLRGIDVAMLYQQQSFEPLKIEFIPVAGMKEEDDPTRDILCVKGILRGMDTVNIFVNHWPSRYTGQVETMHKRQAAAGTLKRFIDSLNSSKSCNRIIIMGDFNDEPGDETISEILGTGISVRDTTGSESPESDPGQSDRQWLKSHCNDLYAVMPPLKNSISGTLRYEGSWYLFDQFIISGGLLNELSSYETRILDHDFLLEPDEAYTGQKPFRTYNGYIYKGGYSDHLPVVLELRFDSDSLSQP